MVNPELRRQVITVYKGEITPDKLFSVSVSPGVSTDWNLQNFSGWDGNILSDTSTSETGSTAPLLARRIYVTRSRFEKGSPGRSS
jgi:hypothetical protein